MKKILTAIILGNSLCGFSQDKFMQIPPAPSIREMEKYTTYNVGLHNGVAAFDIPIHTIVAGKITIPIILSYKATPIENKGTTDEVGTGWMLTPKYSVSRTVYNRVDELFPMPDNILEKLNSFSNPANRDTFLRSFVGLGYEADIPNTGTYWDSEYDQFNYNVGSSNGSFIITDRANRQIRQISKNTTKISYLQDAITQGGADPIPAGIKYFEVTDGNGIKYEMGKQAGSNETLYGVTEVDIGSAITTWYASKITDQAGNTVKIRYTKSYETDRNLRATVFVKNNARLPDIYNPYSYSPGTVSHNTSIPYQQYKVMQVKSIETENERVFFYRQQDNSNEGGRIDSIIVVNMNNERVKKVQFHYSFSWIHHMLDSVTFIGSSGEMQRYRFEYNNRGSQYEQDFWGFYAASGIGDQKYPAFRDIHFSIAPISNNHPCPLTQLHNIIALNNIQQSLAAESYVLKKIYFPTGGSRNYEYEPHQYTGFDETSNSVRTKEMGIRVKQISSNDGHGNTLIEYYKYGVNEDGLGIVYNDMARTSWLASEGVELLLDSSNYNWAMARSITYHSVNPYAGMVNAKGSIYYLQVTVHQKKETFPYDDNGKTEYFFNTDQAVYTEYGCTNYDITSGLSCSVLYEVEGPRIYRPYHIPSFETWKQPFLKEVRQYAKRNNVYFLTKKKEYSYIQKDEEYYTGLHVQRFASCYPEYFPAIRESYYHVPSLFDFAEYSVGCAANLLSQEKETLYDVSGVTPINTVTVNFEYNDLNQLSARSTTNSKNKQNVTIYKYPADLVSSPVYQQMVEKNILNQVIEDTRKVDLTQTFYAVTNYGLINGLYLPVSEKYKYGNNNLETKHLYNAFDLKGNILEQQKPNDAKEVFLWGYRGQYPVARVVGSDYVTVKSFIDQTMLDSAHLYMADQLRSELNKIRNGLANTQSQVFTYTYRPSIGMTSETDANGKTIYYSYDGFGRLSFVKDKDGKVLKKICYNYSGQQTDCNINMSPVWTATGNLQCEENGGSNTGYQLREEKDSNPNSPTYNQVQWVFNGYNPTACPPPNNCNYYICTEQGPMYTCVYGQCEQGYRVNTASYYDPERNQYLCIYHYEWSDGSWSQDYTEYNSWYCPL